MYCMRSLYTCKPGVHILDNYRPPCPLRSRVVRRAPSYPRQIYPWRYLLLVGIFLFITCILLTGGILFVSLWFIRERHSHIFLHDHDFFYAFRILYIMIQQFFCKSWWIFVCYGFLLSQLWFFWFFNHYHFFKTCILLQSDDKAVWLKV